MRWPFWRRAAPVPVPPRGPVVPLSTVSDRHRPTVTGFGLPDVAGTRSLLARPPIVPGPTAPRGRLYGTVVVRHRGPVARRGRLPSLRHLFTGQPSAPPDTPQPWAVRVIDRPASFDPSTDEGWPEPQQMPESMPVGWPEPHQVPESAQVGWPEPRHVLESAQVGWPEPQYVPPSAPFDPFGSPVPSDEDWITSDAIADLQAVLTAARGTPAPLHRTPPTAPPVAQPIRRLTLAESRRRGITSAPPPPAVDDSPTPIDTVEPPASDPDLATVDEPTVPPDPVAPSATVDPEPLDQPDAPPARARVTRLIGRPAPDWPPTVDPVPTSGAEQPVTGRGPSAPAMPATERSGRGSLAPERSVRSGHASATPQPPVPTSGVERLGHAPVSDVERSEPRSSAPERAVPVPDVERSGRDSLAPDRPVPDAEQPVIGLGPLVTDRSVPGTEPPVAGRDPSARERPGSGPSAHERSVADESPLPVGEDDQPIPAGDVPTTVWMLAGHDPLPGVDRSAGGGERSAPEWPAVPTPGADRPDPPTRNAHPEAIPTGHPPLPPRAEPSAPASIGAPRLGLGRPLPPGATRLVAPPPDLAAAVRSSYGVDVSATPIHRGPAATARAATLSARAFTERGEVFLPDQLGPLTTPTARAGLAHELTHVAQQKILGADLPAEWTPAGQALEQHAVAVEHHVRTGHQMTPPPILGPPEMSTADSIQRQPEHDVPLLSWTAPTPPAEPPEPPDELAGYADRLVALCGQRLANLDDSTDLDELAEKIYHRLRDMLRGELLVDRERAGLLSDFR